MTRRLLPIAAILTFLLLLLVSSSEGVDDQRLPPAAEPDKTATIKAPPGFVVEQVAGPPLVEHPMMACFDDQGRLYVAEAVGQNLRSQDLLKNPPNLVRRLEDTNGDGKFDKSTVFADKMTFPMGALWYRGSLYVASPPSLWRLRDTNDDGIADEREEFVTQFGFTGNAADVHGPFLSPSGWIYWADGRHGHQIKRKDGKMLEGKAARIFRCRPDGTEVEVVCGGGMDNPVEVVFTPEGEAIANVNILKARPRMDALIHCIEGGAYPWHNVHNEFVKTGDLLPELSDLGWVATSGLMRYRSDALGKQYQSNLFSTHFNRHRVARHVLKRKGASFTATNVEFLISSDDDFHPTDVLEDADGSLLVIDTGGWFRIGCPNSRIAKPQIKGGIYRVRRKDAPPIRDARGTKLAWSKLTPERLADLLNDPRPAVRDRAIDVLAQRGNKSLPVLLRSLSPKQEERRRRNALWSLARNGSGRAQSLIRGLLRDKSDTMRLTAAHVVGLNRDAKSLTSLMALVRDDVNPAIRREAATALGRIKNKKAAPALLDGLARMRESDRFLEHSLIYALIEIGDENATLRGLANESPQAQRGALIALDQMSSAKLAKENVLPLLRSGDGRLQQSALQILSKHPAWAKDVGELVQQWLADPAQVKSHRAALRGALLGLCGEAAMQKSIADLLLDKKTPRDSRLLLLEVVADSSLKKLPPSWTKALETSLAHPDADVVLQAIFAIGGTGVHDLDNSLLALAKDDRQNARTRLEAFAVIAPRQSDVPGSVASLIAARLRASEQTARLQAAQAFANLPLDEKQLSQFATVLAKAGPLELPHLLAPYARSKSEAVGDALVEALQNSPGFSSLSRDALDQVLKSYPDNVREKASPLFAKLSKATAEQQAKLRQLESILDNGDVGRGRSLFYGSRAACAACHRVQGKGDTIGPDLSKIGAMRSSRDLLESIIVPSSSFARGYEPFIVTMKKGQVHTGVLGRETASAIYVITTDRTEKRVLRDQIEVMRRGTVSIMPKGLDEQLTREEMRDLLAYLRSLR